jgi:ATP-dependent protease ClpP protease subunit
MKVLKIEGVIGEKGDTATKGEKFFSYADLENFLASHDGEPFEAVINSPGGSVEEGFKIYDALRGLDVTTRAVVANSIASVIFLAGKVRKVSASSEIIIHNAWVDAEVLTGEKLNFHTLQALTQIFAETDLRILNVYAGIAGDDKAAKILALMAQETNVDAVLALALGFATEVEEVEAKALAFRNRVLTYSKNQIEILDQNDKLKKSLTNLQMNNEEKVNAFEKALKGFKNLFKLTLKNMATTTAEGVAIFIAGAEDGELVGKSVYLAEEGLPTETIAPAGSHTLEDGSVIMVDEAGVITEVVAAAPVEDVEALKATITAMEGDKEEMKASLSAMEDDKEELKAQIANLTKAKTEEATKLNALVLDFEKLKNEVSGDPDKKKAVKGPLSSEEFAKLTPGERIKMQAMNRAEVIKK